MYFNTVVIHSDNSNYHSFLFIAGIVNPTPNHEPDSHPEPYVEDGMCLFSMKIMNSYI